MTGTEELGSEPESNVTANKPRDTAPSSCPLTCGVFMFLRDQNHLPRRLLGLTGTPERWPIRAPHLNNGPRLCCALTFITSGTYVKDEGVGSGGVRGGVSSCCPHMSEARTATERAVPSLRPHSWCVEEWAVATRFCGPPHCHIPLQEPEK